MLQPLSNSGELMRLLSSQTILAAAPELPVSRLLFAAIPAVILLGFLHRWRRPVRPSLLAVVRMTLQLTLLGLVLESVFVESNTPTMQITMVTLILTVMVLASSWIALRVTPEQRWQLIRPVFVSVLCSGGLTLLIVTQVVIRPDPWYLPRMIVPLAGMIFSSCMNAVSLSVERYNSETQREGPSSEAKYKAFEAAMIPITNSLYAVGLVSIPGMMTGQVLSGEPTMNAAKYQMMVMLMIFGASGLSAAMCLTLLERSSAKNPRCELPQ